MNILDTRDFDLQLAGERLLHWLAFAATATAVVLAAAGCGQTGDSPPARLPSFGTDRTLTFKIAQPGRPAAEPAAAPPRDGRPQLLATAISAAEIRRLTLRIFNDEATAAGVYKQADIQVPPFAGTLVVKGVRPGRKLVAVEAFNAAGGLIFSGGQVVDFAPGAARFVEFLLLAVPPVSARDFRGGLVSTDVRLAFSQSPYTITTPIFVSASGSLVIEGGVDMRFETPAFGVPDITARGRILVGSPERQTRLRRLDGLTSAIRIRIEESAGSAVTNTEISEVGAIAVELSAASVIVSSNTIQFARAPVPGTTVGLRSSNALPMLFNNVVSGAGRGIELVRSTGLVQGNRITNCTTGIAVFDSSAVVTLNIVSAAAGATQAGIRCERSSATVSQNRITGTTAVVQPVTGTVIAGLEYGIVLVDSVSGTPAVSSRVTIDRNTVQRAAVGGILIMGSDPLVSFNRVIDGAGAPISGSQGVVFNRIQGILPRQPRLVSNVIADNSGPAVGFLPEPQFSPPGGGVLGEAAGRGGNFIRGNNALGQGFVPGADSTVSGPEDGVFLTQTPQIFSVDAILAASSTAIVEAGAPASVK